MMVHTLYVSSMFNAVSLSSFLRCASLSLISSSVKSSVNKEHAVSRCVRREREGGGGGGEVISYSIYYLVNLNLIWKDHDKIQVD